MFKQISDFVLIVCIVFFFFLQVNTKNGISFNTANVSVFPISYPLFESQNKTKNKQAHSDDSIVLTYLKSEEFYILLSAFTDYY